jgi:hypothetical protein
MELTLTQNSALYLTHNKISKRRSALFHRLGASARFQQPDVQRQTVRDAHPARRFHPANIG